MIEEKDFLQKKESLEEFIKKFKDLDVGIDIKYEGDLQNCNVIVTMVARKGFEPIRITYSGDTKIVLSLVLEYCEMMNFRIYNLKSNGGHLG
jgi:hypothetical protein